ncbi:hypothetical protein KCH_64140 [Kitasatospora cheerisanensis KCTC 2395]|uniref:Uncharacterized protein n=1 Tax=Kitasatospora cheerisanensis KCTC 2395 TaxID=1348663 RepID=A0A066YP20_9ACTN|nr:hypothetical protein KCH_64140 [Kitasatospora cheerisanensis KCTC 2395]
MDGQDDAEQGWHVRSLREGIGGSGRSPGPRTLYRAPTRVPRARPEPRHPGRRWSGWPGCRGRLKRDRRCRAVEAAAPAARLAIRPTLNGRPPVRAPRRSRAAAASRRP